MLPIVSQLKNKISFAALLLCLSGGLQAQYATQIKITNLNSNTLTTKIESAVSKMFTELNHACFEKRKPKLDKSTLTSQALDAVLDLWKTSPFRCIETELIQPGIISGSGYQVRNIPVYFDKAKEDDNYEELAINFNSAGVIEAVYISIQTGPFLDQTNSDTDMRRRQVILDFVENFRTAYGRKDLPFITQVYSDDALIITGRVVKQKAIDSPYAIPQDKVELVKQTKKQYLAKLAQIFKGNSYIYLDFDEIKITQHPKFDTIYGVELKQGWHTDRYSDEGYLFLMIDFHNELQPMIQVRTWTPDSMFDLNSFNPEKLN
ncbi:hypothetical protein FACS189430_09540 [Bacteroidia bacterium]|nr:hypothetical protein FACS189430_09540 [Bacteroidia bacterium]